jgi:hypothetical protein
MDNAPDPDRPPAPGLGFGRTSSQAGACAIQVLPGGAVRLLGQFRHQFPQRIAGLIEGLLHPSSPLRRLHELTGGWWWWWNLARGAGLGEKEFLPTAAWEETYARTVDDKERTIFAVIDGKPLRSKEALEATAKLLWPLLKRREQQP